MQVCKHNHRPFPCRRPPHHPPPVCRNTLDNFSIALLDLLRGTCTSENMGCIHIALWGRAGHNLPRQLLAVIANQFAYTKQTR
eukprot:5918092-Amphidinium_carterae.1